MWQKRGFEKMKQERAYKIHWTYRKNGEIVAGGEAEYKGTSPDNALQNMMVDVAKQYPDYQEHDFTTGTPELTDDEKDSELELLRQFVRDIANNAPDQEPTILTPSALPFAY